jgi:transcription-repair coupling factor (superfamily II helicase)
MPSPRGVDSGVDRLREEISRGRSVLALSGATSTAAKAFALASAFRGSGKTAVVVADSNSDLEAWCADLEFFTQFLGGKGSVLTLPSFEADPYAGVSPHAETEEVRALTLWTLARSKPSFLVVSSKALLMRMNSPAEIAGLGAELAVGGEQSPDELIEGLVASGYVREEPIKNIGEFSVRGGIVDVWSPDSANPVRIEFFGDNVESIRQFDPDSQLSVRKLKEVSIAPMREFRAGADDFRDWAVLASDKFTDERQARAIQDRAQFAVEGEPFSGWEYLIPLVKERTATVFDFLKEAVFVVDEPVVVEQTLTSFLDHAAARFEEVVSSGEIGLSPGDLFLSGGELRDRLAQDARIELRALGRTDAAVDEQFAVDGKIEAAEAFGASASTPMFLFPQAAVESEVALVSRPTRKFHGNIKDFAEELKRSSARTFINAGTSGMGDRINEVMRDYDVVLEADQILIGPLSGGFEMPSEAVAFVTEQDIFGETSQGAAPKPVRAGGGKPKLGAFISDFRDLKPGDFVVHVDHGIGKFEGLETIASQGAEREFMLLVYADNTKLFVPVERLDLVSRYSSGEATAPPLDRLGGIGWQKTKAKAKRAMRDMADELLRLYAERRMVAGHAFPGDTPWQTEFEDAFPYQLTVDQANAIDDVKSDMEKPVPMDRLIVGDVGYGKTEVAMRAAFKAVMDGKQVIVLTPTTVLAYQHSETFKKRFAAFPVKIELLSRFRSAKEQKAVAEEAGRGEVDILIGTHRVLSSDVRLPNLGLVIVDEEQRFGVAHKEKLKQLKKKVDVLTLSATPIPRTLNMSLLGMRDLSVIETPPRDRLAINTQVVQFSEGVIASAIELEMARSGQVFFVHNRVETIDVIAAHVKRIVPQARIVVAHGQMNEKQMEQAVLDFVDFKFDVLIATTIIENGIDIPRANTIIVNRADAYGLSQLYQLRGRVGRSNRRAYAYLLIPGELELTPIARRRLSAIREFSDLGAGFRIAALDLELRGAGDILGGQQSGQIDALGFDLYTKILERTIQELKGETVEDEISVSINLGVDVSIPKDYIQDTGQRLRTYKRISSASSEGELSQIRAEVEDRYGQLPNSAENLFEYARLRQSAEKVRVLSIDRTKDGVAVKLNEDAHVDPVKLMALVESAEGNTFSPTGVLRVVAPGENPIAVAMRSLVAIEE